MPGAMFLWSNSESHVLIALYFLNEVCLEYPYSISSRAVCRNELSATPRVLGGQRTVEGEIWAAVECCAARVDREDPDMEDSSSENEG